MRGYVEFLSALENWRVGGPRQIVDEDKLDVHQCFLDFDWGQNQPGQTVVRMGRQEMALGSGRLVALREGTNVPFSFDGVRAQVHRETLELDVFATKPVQNRIGIFDDPPRAGSWFWGVYSSSAIHLNGHPSHFDPYYLGLARNPAVFNQGKARETRHTIGTRIWNFEGAWNYDAEGMFQFGSFGNGDIRAWRVASDTSYGFASVRWQPRLGFAADVASGDRDPFSPKLETFNALFQSGTYSGRAQILDLPTPFGSSHRLRRRRTPAFRSQPGGAFTGAKVSTMGSTTLPGICLCLPAQRGRATKAAGRLWSWIGK